MNVVHTLVGTAVSYRQIIDRKLTDLADKRERGGPTLEHVMWAAGIAVVAAAVIAIIVTIIQNNVAKIPR